MNLQRLKGNPTIIESQLETLEITKSFIKLPETQQQMVLAAAVEYDKLNQQEKFLKARRDNVFRPIVESIAESCGIADEQGSLHLVIKDELEDEEVTAEVVRQRKVSLSFNPAAAEKLIEEKGLHDCMVEVVSYEFDEDKIIEAYNCGIISAAELDEIFPEKISWATVVRTTAVEVKEIETARKQLEANAKLEKEMLTIESTTTNK